jgi:hypothetical protein
VTLPGASDYAAPTLALQFRLYAFGNEVIGEPTCHPRDWEPDRISVNFEQRLELTGRSPCAFFKVRQVPSSPPHHLDRSTAMCCLMKRGLE